MYCVEEKHYCEVYFKCMAAIETLITELQYLSLNCSTYHWFVNAA